MPIYKGKQLDFMRDACGLARDILLASADQIKPGVTTGEVDAYATSLMKKKTKIIIRRITKIRKLFPVKKLLKI